MDNKEQLDQNPATAHGQEENSQAINDLTNAGKNEEIAVENPLNHADAAADSFTMTVDDEQQIRKLIHDHGSLPDDAIVVEKEVAVAEVIEQSAVVEEPPVISDTERATIVSLIGDMGSDQQVIENEKAESVSPGKKVAVAVEEPVISKSERNEIAELIASNQTVVMHEEDEDDEAEEDDSNQLENLNKLQLVELLEETVQESNVVTIKNKVASIKVQFLKLNKIDIEKEYEQFLAEGGDKESFEHTDDPLEVRFKAAFNQYKENKARHNEQFEKQKQINLHTKLTILDELKNLISSEETLKKTYDEFKILQEKWKEAGPVPAGEITNLWNNYHFLVEKFFDKVKINRELRDLDMRKNLEAKIELCEKAEELLLEKSVVRSFKLLQQYHDEWKEIGPVPQDKKDEIWDRFKNATDQINLRRREHYAEVQEQQQHHYEAKVALCEKIEELITELPETVGKWQNMTKDISDLFNVWRSLGPAPKKQNDEIWKRFKTSMDGFFDAKKEFFGKIKEQQVENYNLKLDLCAQAESMMESTDWRQTTNDLKRLQEDWKNIGPVPKKHSDKVWKRFRAACDGFFKRKSEHFANLRGNEVENLARKKELIEKITAFEILKDKAANLEALKSFQREWMEIGHVPIKQKDQLQAQYRQGLDALFAKMKVSEAELSAVHYEGIIENLKDRPDARDQIRRERINLSNRIAKLRDEINLWENNIGFFANSKQADIMKAEYEKKIKRAKNDLTILETKMKMLREQ